MNKKKSKIEDATTQRFCKKCGDPLTSKSKFNHCDNCRRERAKARKETLGAVGAIGMLALTLIPGVKHFTKK